MITFFISILVLLAAGVAFLMYNKLQEAKAQNAKLLSLNQSVRQLQEKHIKTVEQLSTSELIDQESRKKLIALGNNYFIFQPVNEINVSHFVEMTELFANTVGAELDNLEADKERLTELLSILVSKLPDTPRDFSAGFYLNYVPGLLYEFSQAVESPNTQNEEQEEPNSGSSEELKQQGEP